MVMSVQADVAGRQFGLDWLRIGAFGVLIFYHIGMFFVPWGWHVKTAEPIEWLQWPMMAINPWRLCLLFVISGIVSRALMTKLKGGASFAASRSWRLLIPLFAGMVLFVMPQPWIELRDRGTYSDGLFHFWASDYFEFGGSRGTPLPTWNHLWFVAYLWVYSMILAGAALLPERDRAAIQHVFDGLFSGWRLFVLPIALLFVARAGVFPIFGETHAMVDDPYAHLVYGFAFFFGVGLARSSALWSNIMQNWKILLATAGLACVLTFGLKLAGGNAVPAMLAQSAARALLAWSAILGLLGMAQTHLHYDGPVRRYLTEAIFPYYIVHQTIIVVAGFYLKQTAAGPMAEFTGILAATVIGCVLTYEVARRINWLRPILGLKMKVAGLAPTRISTPVHEAAS
jgi:glucans biosynthesis protein C